MQKDTLNRFLVDTFNRILRDEERALSGYPDGSLTVHEFHLIEAAAQAVREQANTMGELAGRLGVTVGTLTTAVKTLERKGFLLRERVDRDRRIVRVALTNEGEAANRYHIAFHQQMVDAIMDVLGDEQLAALAGALTAIAGYFEGCGR